MKTAVLYRMFQVKDDAELAKSLEIYQQRHGCPPVAMWVNPESSVKAPPPSTSLPVVQDARMATGYVYFELPGQKQPTLGL